MRLTEIREIIKNNKPRLGFILEEYKAIYQKETDFFDLIGIEFSGSIEIMGEEGEEAAIRTRVERSLRHLSRIREIVDIILELSKIEPIQGLCFSLNETLSDVFSEMDSLSLLIKRKTDFEYFRFYASKLRDKIVATHDFVVHLDRQCEEILNICNFVLGTPQLLLKNIELDIRFPADASLKEISDIIEDLSFIFEHTAMLSVGDKAKVARFEAGSAWLTILLNTGGLASVAGFAYTLLSFLLKYREQSVRTRHAQHVLTQAGIAGEHLSVLQRQIEERLNNEAELLANEVLARCAGDKKTANNLAEARSAISSSIQKLDVLIEKGVSIHNRILASGLQKDVAEMFGKDISLPPPLIAAATVLPKLLPPSEMEDAHNTTSPEAKKDK